MCNNQEQWFYTEIHDSFKELQVSYPDYSFPDV